jgi:hypothetical protein
MWHRIKTLVVFEDAIGTAFASASDVHAVEADLGDVL